MSSKHLIFGDSPQVVAPPSNRLGLGRSLFRNAVNRVRHRLKEETPVLLASSQLNSGYTKTTYISTSILDRKNAKVLFGRVATADRTQAMSSCNSLRSRVNGEDDVASDGRDDLPWKTKWHNFMKRYFLISPLSGLRLVWDLLSIVFILYSCLQNAFKYHSFISTSSSSILFTCEESPSMKAATQTIRE